MRLHFIYAACASLLLFSSCNFKPEYQRPTASIPNDWRFKADMQPSDVANLKWWEQFNDPLLNQLIEEALLNNQNLLIASSRVLEFYAKFGIVSSQLYPELDLNANVFRQELSNNIDYAPVTPGTRYSTTYALSLALSYEIDFWGKLRNAEEAAHSRLLAQIQSRRQVILTLISNLASAYIQLRQYDKQLDIAKLTYESRVESLRLATMRYEIGLVSEMEVKQAEAEAELALIQVKQYEEIIPQQEDLICVLVGKPPESIARGKLLQDFSTPPIIPSGIPSDLLTKRPDIVQAEQDLIAANAEIGVARAAFFPTISLTALFGNQSTDLSNFLKGPSRNWNTGLAASQPLFTGFKLTYQLEEAKALAREAIHSYKQTILNALQDVNNSLIVHQKSKEIYDQQVKLISSLSDYLQLATLRYENGQNDYLTVLDAERALFRAQLDLAESQGNIFLSMVSLYKALGGGWVVDADYTMTRGERPPIKEEEVPEALATDELNSQ